MTAGSHQVAMGTRLDDSAGVHYDNAVGVDHRGQPMRDHDDRAPRPGDFGVHLPELLLFISGDDEALADAVRAARRGL